MDQQQMEKVRHSLSHLMSMALMEKKYPQAGLGVGPFIENGFYQDYDLPESISEKDFEWIEKRMRQMIAQKIKFVQSEVSYKDALKFYTHDPYKTEMIRGLKAAGEKNLSFYDSDWFHNLCAGPHVKDTGEINPEAFKLMSVAGAYWRGSEKNKMLTRVYGVAFADKKELSDYLEKLKLAEERDHRKLGKELELFVFSDLVGPGLPLFAPKGALVRQIIADFSNELQKSIGYQEVRTPNINKAELFKVSGHYEKYKDDMLMVKSHYSDEEYFLKPMNCPQHTQIYASKMRSYRDLPVRLADFANLYRDEKPGELNGLTRLRCFCQDDGHSFCREDQIKDEFLSVLGAINKAMKVYGMDYKIRLSLWDPEHPEKYLGDAPVWEKSQKLLEEILIDNKIEYYRAVGEAAIYGPKMDLLSKDSLGREWQISTIQLDFIMPQRFGLSYIDENGRQKTPVMIHRAIVGSPERFMSILIEHYGGAFPVWLAPTQVLFAPVGEAHADGAMALVKEFTDAGIRAEADDANESIGKKVRNAAKKKIPYIVVVGDKELSGEEWTIRARGREEQVKLNKKEFANKVLEEVKERK